MFLFFFVFAGVRGCLGRCFMVFGWIIYNSGLF